MKTNFFILIILILCFGFLGKTKAQSQKDTVPSFTLQEAIAFALEHQVNVKNAGIDEQIANNTVKKTIGIGLPQISGNANFQDFIKIPTNLIPGELFGAPAGVYIPVKFGVKYNSSVGLEASQLIFDSSYLIGLKASKTYEELSIKSSRRTRIETAIAVTKAYYSVLVSNEQLGLIDANLKQLTKSFNDIQQLYKNGFAEKVDVDRLSVLKNNLITERENVVQLLVLNFNLLKFQMGKPINSLFTLKDKIEDINASQIQTPTAEGVVYAKRIEYSLLQTQFKIKELDLKRYKTAFLPSLVGFGSYSINFQNNNFKDLYKLDFPVGIIGLKLNIPLISGGQKLYQLRNAKLEVLKAQNDIDNIKNVIDLEVSHAQTAFLNSQRSLENQKRNMDLAQEVLRIIKIKYEQGVGSGLEVIAAETSLKEAQNNYIKALYDMLINKVDLDKALGNITY